MSEERAAYRREREGHWNAIFARCEVKNLAGDDQCPDAAVYVLSRDDVIGRVCLHHLDEFLAMLTKRGPVTVQRVG